MVSVNFCRWNKGHPVCALLIPRNKHWLSPFRKGHFIWSLTGFKICCTAQYSSGSIKTLWDSSLLSSLWSNSTFLTQVEILWFFIHWILNMLLTWICFICKHIFSLLSNYKPYLVRFFFHWPDSPVCSSVITSTKIYRANAHVCQIFLMHVPIVY